MCGPRILEPRAVVIQGFAEVAKQTKMSTKLKVHEMDRHAGASEPKLLQPTKHKAQKREVSSISIKMELGTTVLQQQLRESSKKMFLNSLII